MIKKTWKTVVDLLKPVCMFDSDTLYTLQCRVGEAEVFIDC
jgi:hypothetical protein